VGKLFAAVLAVITLVSVVILVAHVWWLPPDISARGWMVDRLVEETVVATGFLFVAAQLLLALFAWKYGEHNNERKIKIFPGGPVPLVVLVILVVGVEVLTFTLIGSKVWASVYMTPVEPGSVRIDVQAEQFAFYFRYPGPDGRFGEIQPELINDSSGNFFGLDRKNDPAARDDIVSDTLAIPVNRPILLTLHSQDVGHAFFVRELRMQQDFVPGLVIPVHFTAIRTGKYEIVCTQLCGLGHYSMRAYLEVMPQDRFDTWLKTNAAR
jgi:cytochrome c oxidase subunit 2